MALGLIIGVSACLFTLAFYRLYLHPLAAIPGPTLAALTGWYETYFELFHKGGGQFTFHIKDLHNKYGPIVRINPDEVHIDDPSFYSKLYNNRDGHDKPPHLKWRFGSPYSLFSTPEHHIHKTRRSAQDPFFSRRRVLEFTPSLQLVVDKLCDRLSRDFVDQDRPITLNHMFTSYIADVTTLYAFGRDFGYLDDFNFESHFVKAIRSFKSIAQPFGQFPWLARLMGAIPNAVIATLQPSMSAVLDFKQYLHREIQNARQELIDIPDRSTHVSQKTIIHGILSSDLPPDELSPKILQDQAVGVIGAGIASSQWTLVIAFFHIISNQDIYMRLKSELALAIPNPNEPVSLENNLEKCPWLLACIEEGKLIFTTLIP